VRIGRSIAKGVLVIALAQSWGCGLGPRNFRKFQHPAPLVRARAIGLDEGRPDSQVVPALIGRLEDPDPVVRLAAHEELRRRTHRDFGFVPWASFEERSGAIGRWWAWLKGSGSRPVTVVRSTGRPRPSGKRPPALASQSSYP
jgi:hypothetical protein